MIKNQCFIDLINYKIGYKIYGFLKHKNHPNIILYGNQGIGKTILIKTVLHELFHINLKRKVMEDYILYLSDNIYYFNCSYIQNKKAFITYIKDIIKSYDHFNNQIKYIIFDQFNNISDIIQNSLKVIIEKAYYTCKFIIITNNYNKVINPIRSRCIGIRIPSPNQNDKYIYLKTFFNKRNIFYNRSNLFEDCKISLVQDIINKYSIKNYIDIQDLFYREMYRLITIPELTKGNIIEIRKLSSKIKELNIPLTQLIQRFILENNTSKVIRICAENEVRINNSYRELMHIESLILHLHLVTNYI